MKDRPKVDEVMQKISAVIEHELGVIVCDRSLSSKFKQEWNSERGHQMVWDLDFHALVCSVPEKKAKTIKSKKKSGKKE